MTKHNVKHFVTLLPAKQLMKLVIHPAAELFPMMDGTAMDALVANIKANGQSEPILIAGDVLVDGRNRLQACHQLGIKVRVKDLAPLSEEEIKEKVVSLNVNRRHLTSKERAGAALRFYEAQKSTTNKMTSEQVAKLFGICRRTLSNARQRRDADGSGSSQAKKGRLKKILADFSKRLGSITEVGEKRMAKHVQEVVSACQEEIQAS